MEPVYVPAGGKRPAFSRNYDSPYFLIQRGGAQVLQEQVPELRVQCIKNLGPIQEQLDDSPFLFREYLTKSFGCTFGNFEQVRVIVRSDYEDKYDYEQKIIYLNIFIRFLWLFLITI